MSTAFILWTWENPINLTATLPATMTWEPNTFDTAGLGNSCNIWLLRKDFQTDVQILAYPPALLVGNQNVYNNSFRWTPSTFDIDVDVPQAGTHQLAWELTIDNEGMQNNNNSFRGFSQGFQIRDPSALSSTSSTAPITSSTQTSTLSSSLASTLIPGSSLSSQTSSNSASSSSSATAKTESYQASVSKSTAVGLGVGLGVLLIVCIAGGFWFHRMYRRQKALAATVAAPALPQYKRELDGRGPWKDLPPTEIYTGKLTPTIQELGES